MVWNNDQSFAVNDDLARSVAANVAEIASNNVLRILANRFKNQWDRNPALNPKRALQHCQPRLEQSSVGLRDFVLNAECIQGGNPNQVRAQHLERAVKRARLSACIASPDDMRLRALSLIKIMVSSDEKATAFGARVFSQDVENYPSILANSIKDAFSSKATATVYKRVQALWKLYSWIRCSRHSSGLDITEEKLYDYSCVTRAVARPAVSRFFNQ